MSCSKYARAAVTLDAGGGGQSSRNLVLAACFTAAIAAFISRDAAGADKRPADQAGKMNVLFIAVDDLNDWTSFLGGWLPKQNAEEGPRAGKAKKRPARPRRRES